MSWLLFLASMAPVVAVAAILSARGWKAVWPDPLRTDETRRLIDEARARVASMHGPGPGRAEIDTETSTIEWQGRTWRVHVDRYRWADGARSRATVAVRGRGHGATWWVETEHLGIDGTETEIERLGALTDFDAPFNPHPWDETS